MGQSRKFVIPLSEYFDREKVTLRVGEKRLPARPAVDPARVVPCARRLNGPETSCLLRRTAGRILVVDDQRNMRATTALLLRAEGYAVDEAGGGEEALRVLWPSSRSTCCSPT